MATLDPEQERKRLIKVYSDMSDGELEKLASDLASLTDSARIALREEMNRRDLSIDGRTFPNGAENVEFRELVTIRQFRDLPEALLAKGSLESAGIECFLSDDNYVRLDWFISNFIGGIKLRVNPQDVDAAKEVLDQPIPESFDVEGVGHFQQPHCPICQSLDVTFQELNQPIAYVTAYFHVPIPLLRTAWRCRACYHEWQDENPEPNRPSSSEFLV